MASTFDSIMVGVEYADVGDFVNTYGVNMAHPNWQNLAKATHGVLSLAMTGDTTISETNGATDNETENSVIVLTGSLSSAANLTIPSRQRHLLIYNTTG